MKQFTTAPQHESRADENTTDLLLGRLRADKSVPIYELAQSDGRYVPLSTADFIAEVKQVAKGLIASGVESGDVVAILSRTRYEWALADWAVWWAGGVSVPIYETSSPSQIQWIASDTNARFAIVEATRHREDMESVRSELPALEHIGVIDDGIIQELTARGADVSDDDLEARRTSRTLDDVATIIYTSGTTGRPKGAELTHGNFVDTSRSALNLLGEQVLPPGSRLLMFLPLAHVFARLITVLAASWPVTTAFTPDTKNLLPDLAAFKPTFLLAVPRVFEKVYNGAEAKAIAGGRGKIFTAASDAAIAYSLAQSAGKVPFGLKAKHALFEKLVYGKLREAMGGDVRWAVSGGAPLGARLAHFFRGIGVTVLEGYGLTETTAPVCVNLPWAVEPGTVGPPLPGSTVAIDDNGEILVKGVMVFAGYHHNPEATAEALQDGWFRTGDLGSLDEQGALTITGRTKEVIVTAGGKNISPAQLEDQLRSHPLVSQCVVIGDQKPFVAAILTLDAEMLPTWLKNNSLPEMSISEAAQDERVLAEVQTVVDKANRSVSKAESIRAFEVIDSDFTEENGYLTPSLKLKRNVVVKDLAPVIEKIYSRPKPTS
ncbi:MULTISPECIES: AMP-dependent synthetase/ligase [Brachybacterium]|uniref:AMP-dependent synthetase/ligase n=1 Tax=Brachybacterium TaxID=43668 RepID=UPI000DF34DE4|nr:MULTISPECIES: AMP-dependent synthetase/ligase [Brachybacterium]RCS67136.1 long-chain fatty acid--CoA ligase [Brachybacterium sp. JB7]RCS68246.1 long-chain fatty acid--CoA ligase [Brachybacterium alimentarium]RCS69834.1 long-chain fatty acid--CoA ligase [Brachybacterium alimentarium]RCS77895.1 long-chain fatty acid--CoA ligase [Brachybacterium alimentarium]RCS83846.1 long-chain fatty acid--CoA ligase [Brachybacterium alimentarium]